METDNLKKKAQYLTHLSVLAVCLAGLLNVNLLSWSETLRLLAIQSGILLLFFRHRALLGSSQQALLCRPAAVVLSLCVGFVVTQFDPSTAAIGYRGDQIRLNAFFVVSTMLVGAAMLGTFVAYADTFRWSRLSLPDRVVLPVVVGAVILSLLSPGLTSLNGILGATKLVAYAAIWFTVTRAYQDPAWRPEEDGGRLSWLAGRWRGSLILLTVLFLPAITSGVYRTLFVIVHLNEGQTHYAAGEWEAARASYAIVEEANRSVSLEYAEEQYLRDLAVIEIRTGRSEAVRGYLRAVGHGLDRGAAAEKRGDIYLEAEEWRSAVSSYEMALSENGRDLGVLDKLGRLYLLTRDTRALLEVANRHRYVPDLRPETFDQYIFMGNFYSLHGDDRKALRHFETATDLRPRSAYAAYKMGRVLIHKGDLAEAERHYRRAIQLEPGFADAYYRLGECAEQSGDRERSRAFYVKTLELLPNHLDAGMKLRSADPE